jgi:hypothetical protein
MGYKGKPTKEFSYRFSPSCGERPERERVVKEMRKRRIVTEQS